MSLAAGRLPVSMPARAWVAIGESEALDWLREADRLSLSITFDAFEPEVLGRIPLEAGGLMEVPSGTLVLRVVERSSRKVRVEVGHRWRVFRMLRTSDPDGFEERMSFALYSPRYEEFIMDTGGAGRGRRFSLTGGTTVLEPSRWLEFEAQFAERRDGPPLPDDWFDDVELVAVAARHAGSFTRTIEREIEEWPAGMVPVTVDGYPTETFSTGSGSPG
jgi:hypothetical protein